MSLLHGLWHRAYVVLRGESYAQELAREQGFHREMEATALAHDGVAGIEAELQARRLFGNPTYYREEVRRMTPLHWLDNLRQDIGYAWRGLTRSPGFTATVVLTLGLGLGVNAAMFSLLDRLFVRAPSGVAAPRDVRRLYIDLTRPKEPTGRLAHDSFRYPYLTAIRGTADTAVGLTAATEPDSTAVTEGDVRIPVRRSAVTGEYFDVFGVRPQIGRFFTGEERRIETPTTVAVLSDAFWRRHYNADASVVGRTIAIDFRPYTVVGIAPKDFTGIDIDAVDLWLPANTYTFENSAEPWYLTYRNSFRVFARLTDPRTEEKFLTVATQALRSVHLRGYEYDSTSKVLSGPIILALGPARRQQEVTISTRLAGVGIIVLLITCANVANLLLVRATRRRREIAVRRALGASGMQLYEQLLTESLLLATIGGAVAVLFAFWAGTALRRLLLPKVNWAGGAVDLRTIAFASVATLVVGVLAGIAPALQATQPDVTNDLKAGGREGSRRGTTLRASLLVVQAALSVILLIGAGLFVSSLRNVRAIDLGYDADHSLFIRPIFGATPPSPDVVAATIPQIAERLAGAPGVEAVGYASALPMQGIGFTRFFLPGRDSLPRFGDEAAPSFISVSPGYLSAVGVRVVAGRDFTTGDRKDGLGAVIVSQSMERLYWPGETAVGKCVLLTKRTNPCWIVVGVAEDVRRMRLVEKPTLQFYLPIAQYPGDPRDIAVRIHPSQLAATRALAAAELKRGFPTMSMPFIRLMRTSLDAQFRPWRLGAVLFTAFGVLALIVAAIGVYSVVSYAVSQRLHEMGVRIALGARVRDILSLVAGESVRVVGLGVLLGVAAALLLGRLVASLLYGISARDPVILVASAVILLAIGFAASLVPAIRAARVDPVTALRAE